MQNQILFLLVNEASSGALNVLDLIKQAGPVVKVVMLLLLISSIISWTIILWKWLVELRTASQENAKFAKSFWAAGSLDAAQKASGSFPKAPMTRVFQEGLREFNQINTLKLGRDHAVELIESNLSRSLEKACSIEQSALRTNLNFLASTASTAPFIGLFGTVYGIMTSFINIGATGASNLAVVAPGIAEALIATAMGLFAAIPAALFYNYFANKIKAIGGDLQHFSSDFMNTAKRSI